MRRKCDADVVLEAPPEGAWAVVSDITRVGEWSGECRGCSWTEGYSGAEPGARFKGKNRRTRISLDPAK